MSQYGASYVGRKAALGEEWIVDAVDEALTTEGINDGRLVTKSGQENAITDILRRIARHLGDRSTALEHSQLLDSGNNDRVEMAVQEPMGLIRTLRSALEAKTGCRIDLFHPVVDWMVRHAGVLITRYMVPGGGRCSYRLVWGRDSYFPW